MLKLKMTLAVAAIALPCEAFAQAAAQSGSDEVLIADLRLEAVNVAGLRPVEDRDVSVSVTTLTVEDLAVRATPYVADQLRAVPGVGVSRSGARGGLTQVRIRGGEANHTLVLLDGIEVSDPTTGETDFGLWSGVNVERIEVARGEQSALYGSDAIGGVVALTTGGEGLTGALEGGSYDSVRANLGYRRAFRDGFVGIGLSGNSTSGVDTSGNGGETDGSEGRSAIINAGWTFAADWQATALASYRESQVQTDPDIDFDGRLDNANRENDSEQWLIGGRLEGMTGPVSHILRASATQVRRENRADGTFSDRTIGERSKLAWSPSIELEAPTGDMILSGLIDWESEDYQRVGIPSFFGDPNQTAQFETFGLAGEARYVQDGLSLVASARHDANDGLFDDATTWRVGAAYSFDFGTKLRASAGTGVKNPTFTELFGFIPASFIGNRDLKPEQSTSWEIGWDQAFGPVETSLTYFSAELEDEIFTRFNPDFTSTADNRTGNSERDGVEASLQWTINDSWTLNSTLSKVTSQDDFGRDEIRVPEWTGSVALNGVFEQYQFGLAADYVGEQGDTDFGTFQPVSLDEYWLVSARFEMPVTEGLALTLQGENLLDEEVTDVFGFHGRGAGIFAGVKLRL